MAIIILPAEGSGLMNGFRTELIFNLIYGFVELEFFDSVVE